MFDRLKKFSIPRTSAEFEIFLRKALKVVFWILLLAPVVVLPLFFLATTILGIPVRLG